MRYKTMLLATLWLAASAAGETEAPFAYQLRQVDRIFEVAAARNSDAAAALSTLELVASGRSHLIAPGLDAKFGLRAGELNDPNYRNPTVRAHAFRRIGQTGMPEALRYLEAFRLEDWGNEDAHQIWPSIQIGIREGRLLGMAEGRERTEFLEATIQQKNDSVSNSAVASWAVDQLCDSGAMGSLAIVRESIRMRDPTERGEEEIRYCEARMSIDVRGPNRVKALGAVLNVVTSRQERRLARWAVHQLGSMESLEADQELDRFESEIARLPDGSAEKQGLFEFQSAIRKLRDGRGNRGQK